MWILPIDGYVAEFIRRSVGEAALDAAACHPGGEALVVVIAAVAALGVGRAAELAAPQDQRIVEQAACFQVLQQARDRLVDARRLAAEQVLQIAVMVPLAGG